MRVLLVNPKMSSGWKPYTIPPIGLCYLKSSLVASGIKDVKVLDAGGIDIHKVIDYIKEWKPDVVGVTIFTEARWNALAILKAAKEFGCVTIAGGVHASALPGQILSYSYVDHVVIGEGELALYDLLNNLESEDDIIERGKIKDLDVIPFPDYSDLDLRRYKDDNGRQVMPIVGSRGCPFSCLYCSSKNMWGNLRVRSVENVLDEVGYLYDHSFTNISILDDIFSSNKKRVLEFCNGLLDKKLRIRWGVQTRVDSVDLELLRLMKEAGCWMVIFGVESGSPKILKELNKKERLEDIINAFSFSHKAGVQTTFNVIMGSPGETKQTIEETKILIKACRPTYVSTAVLRVYPGTPLWNKCLEEGFCKEDWFVTNEDETLYYTNSISSNEAYRQIRQVRQLQAQLHGLKGYWDLFKFTTNAIIRTPNKVKESLWLRRSSGKDGLKLMN